MGGLCKTTWLTLRNRRRTYEAEKKSSEHQFRPAKDDDDETSNSERIKTEVVTITQCGLGTYVK